MLSSVAVEQLEDNELSLSLLAWLGREFGCDHVIELFGPFVDPMDVTCCTCHLVRTFHVIIVTLMPPCLSFL